MTIHVTAEQGKAVIEAAIEATANNIAVANFLNTLVDRFTQEERDNPDTIALRTGSGTGHEEVLTMRDVYHFAVGMYNLQQSLKSIFGEQV